MRLTRTVYLAAAVALGLLLTGCEQGPEMPPPNLSTAPLIDPNTADEAALAAVAGLNESTVAAIVAGRPFATQSALHAAIGTGLTVESQRAIYSVMFIPVGLNTGAEADYKLIPSSLSPGKLAHEFEEYRPYESMDQFRQEMAKYMSDEEVEHLARYVTLD